MTAQTPATLKTYFETGDKPTQAQFSNLIDSFVNTIVSAAQTIQSDISAKGTFDLPNGGMVIGSPTGGNKGPGTLNVQSNFYVNGTAIGTPSGSGTVTSAAANKIAYYSGNGNTVDGTLTLPTGILCNDSSAADNSQRIANTKFVVSAVAAITQLISKSFTSSQQTITSGGLLTLPHSLGASPSLILLYLVAQNTANGFSSGSTVMIPSGVSTVATNDSASGCIASFDATNIYIRFSNISAAAFSGMLSGADGSTTNFANTDWKLVVKAFA